MYTPLKRKIAGATTVDLDVAYEIRQHHTHTPNSLSVAGTRGPEGYTTLYASHQRRQGEFIVGNFRLTVAINAWLAFDAMYRGEAMVSNFRVQKLTISNTVNETDVQEWTWNTHIAQLGLSLFY